MIPTSDGVTGQATIQGIVTTQVRVTIILGLVTTQGQVTFLGGVHLMMIMDQAIHQVLFYSHQCPMLDLHPMTMDIECQGIQGTT